MLASSSRRSVFRGIAMINSIQYEPVRFSILASRSLENSVTVHTPPSGCVEICGMCGVLHSSKSDHSYTENKTLALSLATSLSKFVPGMLKSLHKLIESWIFTNTLVLWNHGIAAKHTSADSMANSSSTARLANICAWFIHPCT